MCPLPVPQEKNIKHNGNLTIEDVYEVARVMADRSCAATFAGTVKEMLGTCVSGACRSHAWQPSGLDGGLASRQARRRPAADRAEQRCSAPSSSTARQAPAAARVALHGAGLAAAACAGCAPSRAASRMRPPRPRAVGCTVEHEDPRDIQKKIDDGEIVW